MATRDDDWIDPEIVAAGLARSAEIKRVFLKRLLRRLRQANVPEFLIGEWMARGSGRHRLRLS